MSETANFESDEFLRLLTEALRAGPGSPAWHSAMGRLRDEGVAGSGGTSAEEYRLLCTVREHLESGREWRSVRAGPGFTRKLMEGIDREVAREGHGFNTATLIALVAVGVIVAVVVVLAVVVLPSTQRGGEVPAELRGVFTTPVASGDFAREITAEWRILGERPLSGPRGLRPPQVAKAEEYRQSGVVLANPLPAAQPFAVEATLAISRPTEQPDVQLFVTSDAPAEGQAVAANARELVAWFSSGQVKVVRNGSVLASGEKVKDIRQPLRLVLKLSRQFAVVESDGRTLFAGPGGLPEAKPRYVGVRFLVRGSERPDAVTVQSLRVLKP